MKTECTQLEKLLVEECIDLQKEIDKNKYYLSEKAGKDVGWKCAEKDFIEKFLNAWASGYKKCFCHLVCPDNNDCIFYKNNNI